MIAAPACVAGGSTSSPASTLPEALSTSTVVTAPTTVVSDPSTVVETSAVVEPSTIVVGEPPVTVSLASIDLGDLTICDRLIAADFTNDNASQYRWEMQTGITVVGDDYVDTAEAACVDGTIRVIEDDPQGNYPIIELTEVDDEVAARELVGGDAIPLVVSNLELWSGELELADVDPSLEDARDAGVSVVASLVDQDPVAFRALLHDDVIWFDDNAPTTPDEIMGYAEEDGFPWGDDHSDHDLIDYLMDHVPTVTTLDDAGLADEIVAGLLQIADGADVAVYTGIVRPDVEPRVHLGTDLGQFALMETAVGWRVIAL